MHGHKTAFILCYDENATAFSITSPLPFRRLARARRVRRRRTPDRRGIPGPLHHRLALDSRRMGVQPAFRPHLLAAVFGKVHRRDRTEHQRVAPAHLRRFHLRFPLWRCRRAGAKPAEYELSPQPRPVRVGLPAAADSAGDRPAFSRAGKRTPPPGAPGWPKRRNRVTGRRSGSEGRTAGPADGRWKRGDGFSPEAKRRGEPGGCPTGAEARHWTRRPQRSRPTSPHRIFKPYHDLPQSRKLTNWAFLSDFDESNRHGCSRPRYFPRGIGTAFPSFESFTAFDCNQTRKIKTIPPWPIPSYMLS